jgi:glycosyltransferase involved in cell wall biosynthesis
MTADAVGGVWTYALELARGLKGSGVEVMLAVLGPAPDEAQHAEAAVVCSLAVTGLGLEWQDRAGPLDAAARRKLLDLERAFRPDLVHSNGFREAAAGFRAPVLLAAHSCVATWWKAVRGDALPDDWSAYAAGLRQGLAAADALAAPTQAFAAEFAAVWGRAPRVIPNGLEPSLGTTSKQPRILAAGRLWDEAKNIAALAAVGPGLPWPILIAGEGEADGMHHLGRLSRPDLHRRMGESAIFVAPARYEPFGLGILEAAAAGCALVLGDIRSLRELWSGAALFVPPGSPEALRGALMRLIEDQGVRERLQTAARERALTFGRERMVAGYLALYAELLAARSRRPAA